MRSIGHFLLIINLAVTALMGCERRFVTIDRLDSSQMQFVGLSYFLPRGIVTLTISKKKSDTNKDPNISLTIDNLKYISDPEHHYRINVHHDVFYDDNISVEVDENGLLKAINSTTTDKTPDIIRTIANAPIEILGSERSIRAPAEYFEIKFTLDPTRVEDRDRLNQVLDDLGANVEFSARPYMNLPSSAGVHQPNCNLDPCFRTALPYALELVARDASTVIARSVVVLPNKYIVGQVPLTRAPFVTKKLSLTFTNGMLTKADLDNKSEVLAFVQIPIDVAKAIVGIPSALFSFQVKQLQADNLYLTEQERSLNLQRQIIEAQNKLLMAQVANRAP